MKAFTNYLKIFMGVLVLTFGMVACDKEDYLIFTAQEPSEAISFTNNASDTYLLSADSRTNIAERFVWNKPDFGAPTTVSYVVEGSVNEDFSTVDYSSGTLNETNHAVTINNLIALATAMGLDADPNTNGPDGQPNNSGVVYFRVKAFVGSADAVNNASSVSDLMPLNIVMVEASSGGGGSGVEKSSWGVVGSAANDWGNAGPDLPFYTTDQADVLVAYVNLKDGAMKFRENNDWGNNLGDDGADGTLEPGGADIMVTAGDYKIVLDLNSNTYTIEPYSWGVVGSAYNDWGNSGPDAKLFYDYTTDTWKAGVKLLDGLMKIRLNNDWGTNFGDNGADGTLENGGADIPVTAGFYTLTVNFNDNTYTLESSDLWGIVGSGYNDWGNAGPDFMFTPLGEDKWIAENVTLIDGMIKFRINEDWGVNLGDDGADGTLEANGADIAVTAGTYDIMLDFSGADPTYTFITK